MNVDRIPRLRKIFTGAGLDALLVTGQTNIRYLTRFPAEDAWLLVGKDKVFYITDFRYLEAVRTALKRVEVVQFSTSMFETVIDLARSEGVRMLGIDDHHLTLHQYKRLKSLSSKKLHLQPAPDVVEGLRAIKDDGEISMIRQAIRINLEGFRYLRRVLRPGMTERDVFKRLEVFLLERGVVSGFSPIIASGPNAAFPHAKVTDRKISSKEPVLIDFGVQFKGYNSDLTRMFFLDRMARRSREVLSLIKVAQQEACQVIRPGVEARVVDAAARKFLESHNLAQYFGHSLGHGVGMEVHEAPRLSQKSGAVLLENMVVTIEPGVYFPGKYGLRQEEMVLVTKTGCEVLSGNIDQ